MTRFSLKNRFWNFSRSRRKKLFGLFLLSMFWGLPFWGTAQETAAQKTVSETIAGVSGDAVSEKPKNIYLLSQSLQLGKKKVSETLFSPDDQQIIILSGNHSLELFGAQSGKRLRVIPTQEHEAVSLTLHPGGQLAVTGGQDDTVRIWNTHQTASQGVLRGHLSTVSALALNVTGDLLASGSQDGTVILWEMKTQKLLKSTKVFSRESVRHLVFHPNGKTLAAAGENGSLQLWSLSEITANSTAKMTRMSTLSAHKKNITGLEYPLRGNVLVSGSEDGKLIVWDWKSGNPLREIDFKQPLSGLSLHPELQEVVIGTSKGRLETWSLETGNLLHQIKKSGPAVTRVKYDKNGHRLISALADGSVQIWELGTSLHLKTLSGHGRPVESLDFSKNGKYLLSSAADKSVRIWDVETGKIARTYEMGSHRVQAVRFAPSSQSFATAGVDSSVVIWGTQDGERIYNLRSHRGKVNALSYHPQDAVLLSGGSDRQWTLWDLESGKVLLSQQSHADQILTVAFSPDGSRFATAGGDKSVMLWSYPQGEQLATLKGHRKPITALAFSPDGKFLAGGSQDNKILLWKLAAADVPEAEISKTPRSRHSGFRKLEGHGFIVNQVLFSKEGRALLSISKDKTMRLWEVRSGKMLRILHGDNTALVSAALSPDGKLIALSNLSNDISILNFPSDLPELEKPEHSVRTTEESVALSPETENLENTPAVVEEMVEPETVGTSVVNLDDLEESENRPMTAEELRTYAAPEIPKPATEHLGRQRRLNRLLKSAKTCKNAKTIEKLILQILAKVPNDLAAYHALIKISLLRQDFTILKLAVKAGAYAELDVKRYDYMSVMELRNAFERWSLEVLDQSFERRGNLQELKLTACEGKTRRAQLSDTVRYLHYSKEFLTKINTIPRMLDLRDFMNLPESEFRNRMLAEMLRILNNDSPHPPSRLPLTPEEQAQPIATGTFSLNLEKVQTWKSDGAATFQLRKSEPYGKETWQTYQTDQDNRIVMWLPEGKYYLKVAGILRKTFFLKAETQVDLEIE